MLFQYGSDFCDFQKVAFKKIGNIFVCLFLLFNRVQAIELNTFFNNTMSMENRITVILIIQYQLVVLEIDVHYKDTGSRFKSDGVGVGVVIRGVELMI